MTKQPKHRFDPEEADQAWDLLSPEERQEFDGLNMAGGISTAGNERIRTLETLAYSRLREYNGKA